ncbi:helicase-related protein [Erythrobacter litoralis]|uniref:ATP-dependent helicase n=1 Tax=Erythrobacter litoralis (strain HTCC2594) TaxID=314225 RepID=Q2N6H2_ERYLH|nr:helicase-related protein [Erythrobacter litoralis]ABC64719.1 ATP-dependent helicase [Erythrobacter litoralis HTCC2594]
MSGSTIRAVLGPTNTGKTHLAIERMCGHSSGAIGFPLRLLAREVYDRVVAIKGESQVALITGEERIEPPHARYFLCTAEAMPSDGGGHAFVALDEAQLSADRERGHIFTDRLLHARGREETMLLGSATLEPVLKSLVPRAQVETRPRFSTLTHIGPRKLSRLPPRSAIVGFSAEQVYTVAEMLRRHRGGAAVVMGALSPETRNKQVELFQSGEVDYIVATDAIGMGLNLDVTHVAFASLVKFDGVRQRRLTPAEMAQIAGRAGRHQKDGTFGTLSGGRGGAAELDEEEIFAIEEHRFAPLTHLYWREAEPRFDTIGTLIADLERKPGEPELRGAPEAIDLAVLKKLADEPLAASIKGAGAVRRFWETCSLPDFRQSGADTHARFVARLWQDLREGYLGADYVATRIAELDNMQGDIATLQGRIAAIRSWAYICQRPDWVLARDEMAARARAIEARLSDALHARLTERFVNRRTAILMKNLGNDPNLLPVSLADDGTLLVEDEAIGTVSGFRFAVDGQARLADRKMLLSAGEKALPRILAEQAVRLRESGFAGVSLEKGKVVWANQSIATLEPGQLATKPTISAARDLDRIAEPEKTTFLAALTDWIETRLKPLEALDKLQAASADPEAGSEARALLLALIAGHGYVTRDDAGIRHLPKETRPFLRRLGVVFGALDVFAPALLKPAPRLALHASGMDKRPLEEAMRSVLPATKSIPAGYRPAGEQLIRVDVAEKLVKAAHEARTKAGEAKSFMLDASLAVSTGLTEASFARLLGAAGFRMHKAKPLPENVFGPPSPDRWSWRPGRGGTARANRHGKGRGKRNGEPRGKSTDKARRDSGPAPGNPFADLAKLVR